MSEALPVIFMPETSATKVISVSVISARVRPTSA